MPRSTDISCTYDARPVTASADPLPNGVCRAIYMGVGGDVTGILGNGASSVTFVGVPQGVTLPAQFKIISACPASCLALY